MIYLFNDKFNKCNIERLIFLMQTLYNSYVTKTKVKVNR